MLVTDSSLQPPGAPEDTQRNTLRWKKRRDLTTIRKILKLDRALLSAKENSPTRTPNYTLRAVMEANTTKDEYALILSIPEKGKEFRNSGKYKVHPPDDAPYLTPIEMVCKITLEEDPLEEDQVAPVLNIHTQPHTNKK